MPRRVWYAVLLAFILHGILVLTAQYRLSYDAYIHMFFADHYLRDWWSLWDPRWYTGFEVISYPPLTHQLIALLGRLVGVDAAFAAILWAVLTAYPLAVYAFSRIFCGRSASSYAAMGAAFLPALFLTAHTFGQLPTLAATLLALFGAAVLADFLRHGGQLRGALAVLMFTTVMGLHHATLMFLPWLLGAVLLHLFLERRVSIGVLAKRFLLFAFPAALGMLVVIWPFWEWGTRQSLQTPIDHLSRHNFFLDPFAAVLFFLPMYGLLIPFLPFALRAAFRSRRTLGPGIAFLFLFALGLGDTTPLSRLFFGDGWAWLTYDRFALWAALVLLVFFGISVSVVKRRVLPALARRAAPWTARSRLGTLYLTAMVLVALLIGLVPTWLPTQPDPIEMQPVVDFLTSGGSPQWRYITFGFGDQMALLSRLAPTTSLDGSYHTARTIPELRMSGIGQVDTAYWLPDGLSAVDPILQASGKYGVRWGFLALKLYEPVLERNGWQRVAALVNGIEVWENPRAQVPPPVTPPTVQPWTAFSWGAFPLAALLLTAAFALPYVLPVAGERVLQASQALLVALLPLALSLWYFIPLWEVSYPRVYFTYSDALVFLGDGVALAIILIGLIRRLHSGAALARLPRLSRLSPLDGWLFIICLFASLSVIWSLSWQVSLVYCVHFWLVFALVLTLREIPHAWRWFALGSCAAIAVQAFAGTWQVINQSTAFAQPLNLAWPGSVSAAESGASVVQAADGTRWLRAYGTLPHPNMLGGFTLVFLGGSLLLFLSSEKRRGLPVVFTCLASGLLVLTFSRSAWLGLGALGLFVLWHIQFLDRKRLLVQGAAGMLCLVVVAAPLRGFFASRLGAGQVETEQVSTYSRLWLVERTLELIRARPLVGTGVGTYPLALSRHVAETFDIEPVHNIPLLVASELGIIGLLLLLGTGAVLVRKILSARNIPSILLGGILVGMLVVSLFDHYFWTLAPGRLLFGAVLGLWSGQVEEDGSSS